MGRLEDPIKKDIAKWRGSEKGDEMALSRVKKDWERAAAYRDSYTRDWYEYDRLWRSKLTVPPNFTGISRVFFPMTWTLVDSSVPSYMDALYDDQNFVLGLPRKSGQMKQAESIGLYMNYWFVWVIRYWRELLKTITGMAVIGTAYQRVIQRVSTQLVVESQGSEPQTKLPGETELSRREALMAGEEESGVEGGFMESEEPNSPEEDQPVPKEKSIKDGTDVRNIYFNGPDVRYVSAFDVWPDPGFQEIEDMRYLIHRSFVSTSDLKEHEFDENGKAVFRNLDKIPGTRAPQSAWEDRDQLLANSSHSSKSGLMNQDSKDTEDQLNERLDYWTPQWLITVINRQVVIYNDENPLPFKAIPFEPFRAVRHPDLFPGIGIPEIGRSMQHLINTTGNMKNDNTMLSLAPMYKVVRTGNINTNQLTAAPGNHIHMNAITDLETITFPDVTGTAIANMEDYKRWAEMATGLQAIFRGEQPKTGRFPASLASILQQATNRRLSLGIQSCRESISTVLAMSYELLKAFGDEEMVGRVIGDRGINFVRINRTKLKQTFVDFVPVGKASTGNPDVLLATLENLEQRWKGDPDVDQKALKRQMLRLAGISGFGILKPDAPPDAGALPPGAETDPIAALTAALSGVPGAGAPPGAPPGVPSQAGGGQPVAQLNLAPTVTDRGGKRMIRVPT